MTNFQVYRKTLSYSLVMFLVDIIKLVILVGLTILGFVLFEKFFGMGLAGLPVGLLVAIIAVVLITIFVSNRIKAAQIAMMAKGVTENTLPDHTFKQGFEEVKGRFGSITAFFFITNAIKRIFRQLGRTINRIGSAIGGQTGNTITSAIDSAVQTLIAYLCDCCLAWVMFRKDQNAAKSACEGAVIFFKHGKTLIRNIGRIFGMGFLSLLVIGGAFFGLSYLLFTQFPELFQTLSNEIIAAGGDIPEFVYDVNMLMIYVAAVLGIVIWSMIHSVLIRPFILVGVMRNFLLAGQKDMPKEADFQEVASKSPRFAKLSESI
jgi:Flp pilus assembly pilin Flp